MSIFYYFISKNGLTKETFEKSYLMNTKLVEITEYVLDQKPGNKYYNCDPSVRVRVIGDSEVDSKQLPLRENYADSEYLIWLAEEFYKLGSFRFIRVWEDNYKCDSGYYEGFFAKCEHRQIKFDDFSLKLWY